MQLACVNSNEDIITVNCEITGGGNYKGWQSNRNLVLKNRQKRLFPQGEKKSTHLKMSVTLHERWRLASPSSAHPWGKSKGTRMNGKGTSTKLEEKAFPQKGQDLNALQPPPKDRSNWQPSFTASQFEGGRKGGGTQ